MQAAYRIFCKNFFVLLAIIFVFLAGKLLSVKSAVAYDLDQKTLNNWAEQCVSYDDDAIRSFINQSAETLANADRAVKAAQSAFSSSFSNRLEIQKLISFARNGEGQLPYTLPNNYMELLPFYQKLNTPIVINEIPYDIYFQLQSTNIVPVLVLVIGSVFWGIHYEAEIYKFTSAVKYGRKYIRSFRLILWLCSMALLFSNEVIDLTVSGLLETGYLWEASLQSYSHFRYSQINCIFSAIYALMCCSKISSITLLCFFAEHLAKKSKTLKDTILFAFATLIVLLFLEKGLQYTPYHGIMQLGCVNWMRILENTVILLPTQLSSVVFGLAAILISTCGWALFIFGYSKKRLS